MTILITGATGFLGQRVVAALLRRGHKVRAIVRREPAAGTEWAANVECFTADLCTSDRLAEAFDSVDVLVHLAVPVGADDVAMLAAGEAGTTRLLAAMAASQTKSLVLASSFSVYDWTQVGSQLSEDSVTGGDSFADRDAYAKAKLQQEQLTRDAAEKNGWSLTILRPGFIWGRTRELPAGIGQGVGPMYAVVSPKTTPYLTHVQNCADAFARAATQPAAGVRTFNVVDGHAINNWTFAQSIMLVTGRHKTLLPMPYAFGANVARVASSFNRLTGHRLPLPGLLRIRRYEARFAHASVSNTPIREALGWKPMSFERCLAVMSGNAVVDYPVDSDAIMQGAA